VSEKRRFDVAALVASDIPETERLLDREISGRHQVRKGEWVDVLALPGFVARAATGIVGAVTWRVEEEQSRAELAALAVDGQHRGQGIGGSLTEAAVAAAS
jgi:predicted N-acetyltransferase YhbS